MKKITALLLCLAFALTLCACGKSAGKEQESSEASVVPMDDLGEEINVPEGYELKVAFPENNAPFSFVDESGNLVGADVDIAQAICEKNKWTLTAKPIDWSTAADVLESGEVDCIWGSASYKQTSQSDALWTVYGGIYVDATVLDQSGLSKLSDLKGKVIEVEPDAKFALEGESATELGKQLMADAAKVEDVADAQTAYQDLAQGKCDAIVVSGKNDDSVDFDQFDVAFKSLYDVDIYAEQVGDGSASGLDTMSSSGISDAEMGAAFKEDSDVFYALASSMEEMISKGEVEKIMETWSQKDGAYADIIARCTLFQIETSEIIDGDASVSWDVDPYAEGDTMDGAIAEGSADEVEIDMGEAEDGSVVVVK